MQSIARHDSEFPQIAEYRGASSAYTAHSAMEGGTMIRDSKSHAGSHINTEVLRDRILTDVHSRNELNDSATKLMLNPDSPLKE